MEENSVDNSGTNIKEKPFQKNQNNIFNLFNKNI